MKTFACQYCGAQFESLKIEWTEVTECILFMVLCPKCAENLEEVEAHWSEHIGRYRNG